jgi:hypothetical protein
MNDYLYSRLLRDPALDIPVPGTYETAEGWTRRIKAHGWRNTHSQALGKNPLIQNDHHLLVFER